MQASLGAGPLRHDRRRRAGAPVPGLPPTVVPSARADPLRRARRGFRMLRRVLARLGAARHLTDAAALVGLVVAATGAAPTAALLLLVASWSLALGRGLALLRRALPEAVGPAGSAVPARVLVLLGLTVHARPGPLGWVASTLLALVLLGEDALVPLARAAVPVAAHLPGVRARHHPLPDLDLAQCFNRSDALVSDVSSVIGDYLQSEKPFAVVDVTGGAEEDVVAALPVARAGYVLRVGAAEPELDRVLDDLLVHDPLAPRRAAVKEHVLGLTRGASADQAFLDAARAYV